MAIETSEEDDRQKRHGSSATDTVSRDPIDSDDIEQYGVWVKAGPIDISDDEESEAPFEKEGPQTGFGELTEEEEELLGSLESAENGLGATEMGNEEFFMEDLPELGEEEGKESSRGEPSRPTEVGASIPDQEEQPLDDIGDFELDLADSNQKEVSMGTPEESASILQKIERDLISIKEELTALKNEIYSLRSGASVAEAEQAGTEIEPGFFEEDEDETIALTGDELDNILNTADITEQTGESTASPEDSELLTTEEESEQQPLIDREDVLLSPEEEPGAEVPEINLGDELEELTIDDSLADTAPVVEEPIDELTLEEPEPKVSDEVEELLELPEEEEIVLEELTAEAEPTTEAPEPEAIELDLEGVGVGDETTFELDEHLDLSPAEQEDLAASADLSVEEGLVELGEEDFGAAELAEMEAEAHESAPESVEESFDLTAEEAEPLEPAEEAPPAPKPVGTNGGLPEDLKAEIRTILRYMDQLLESLPEEKIEEFANSEYFDVYKRLFEELGLTT